jgi:hypothetical protein
LPCILPGGDNVRAGLGAAADYYGGGLVAGGFYAEDLTFAIICVNLREYLREIDCNNFMQKNDWDVETNRAVLVRVLYVVPGD